MVADPSQVGSVMTVEAQAGNAMSETKIAASVKRDCLCNMTPSESFVPCFPRSTGPYSGLKKRETNQLRFDRPRTKQNQTCDWRAVYRNREEASNRFKIQILKV